jgi:hypothetical protein
VDEPVDGVQVDPGVRVDLAVGEVEHAAAAHRGQLVPVPDQRDPRTGLIGDGDQRAGGVLVEHARLIDQQQIPGSQPGLRQRIGWCAGPGAGGVPAPAVLPGQPGRRPGAGANFGSRRLRRFERRCDHQ